VILDRKGTIFGGFTPVEWESWGWIGSAHSMKADHSLKSFLFTLKNPHNIPARRFALKAEAKGYAIDCDPDVGPSFGFALINRSGNRNANTGRFSEIVADIYVSNSKRYGIRNQTYLGSSYINDTGLKNDIVFTGSRDFRVEEIEVFEIIG
jgi:hypothetical protein